MRFRRIAVTTAGTALATLAIGATSASAATYSNAAPLAFPDSGTPPTRANPYPSQITVAGHTAPIADLNVNFTGFTHPAPSDVQVLLTGPGGQSLLLMACVGGDGGAGAANDANLKLDDSSGILLPDFPGAPTSGTYKPANRCNGTNPSFPTPGPLTNYANPGPDAGGAATLAQVFNGTSANGVWSLFAFDAFAGGGTGQFAGGWSLEISPDPAAAPAKKKCKKKKKKKGKAGAAAKCKKKKKKKK
jgi:hypothetical protein